MMTHQPTRPSESDMISRPRADAMQRQLDAALWEATELREELARMNAERLRCDKCGTTIPPPTREEYPEGIVWCAVCAEKEME